MVKLEQVMWRGGGGWRSWGGGQLESKLKSWKSRRSTWGYAHSVESYVYDALSNWVVYHFHDTSKNAPMRRDQPLRDWTEFRPDAGNLASFLHRLKLTSPSHYERIRQTIQLVAPFFDEFLLEPEGEQIRLQWQQRGSSRPLQPNQFSDGTVRFICLTTALLQPAPPATVVIDEPELGLHPFALDMLAQLVKECAEGTQVILSTQSPPLLNHFDPEDVIVVDRIESASRFRRLESEPLEGWLREFSLGELLQKNVVEAGPSHA
jgi:predicted ATPase